MNEEKKDFVVKDRRIFSEEKKDETPAESEKEVNGKTEKAPEQEATAETEASQSGPDASAPLPEVNFSTFIFSLNSSALMHLGVLQDPSTGEQTKNLAFAKQTIDILGMLEEKTQGNLEKDEESLLKNILHDLRLMYVRAKG